MKKTLFVALVALMTAITALATDTHPVNITITLKNGETVTYSAAQMDSVRFVGGQFEETGAIGVKIYFKNSTQSVDYLYSQIETMTCTEPVNGTVFRRINDVGQLEAGKRYIIVYEGGSIALPNKVNSNSAVKLGQAVIIENNTIILEGDNHGVGIFTLGEGYTLKYSNPSSDGTYYLTLTNDNSGLRATQNPQNWSITFSGDNAQIVANDGTDDRWIREYDATGGSDFRTYKTTTTNGNPVQLYMEDDGSVPVTTVSAPVFSPNGGLINAATQVTIHSDTEGAAIYYTTDGTTPSTSNGTLYDGPITVSATTTIKAIAIKDGDSSAVTTVTFTYTDGPITDNNVNRNSLSGYYVAGKKMWGLEWPRINETDNNTWVVKSTNNYGVTFSLEWSNSKIANRWTCYTFHEGNNDKNTTRKDAFKEDAELPSATRSTLEDYSGSGYSRGHLCASSDRLCSEEQNKQTFFLSNMQPQWQSHNGGIWNRLEEQVQKWGGCVVANQQYSIICDTLYVVKAATIADVTINGSTSAGVYTQKCNDRLPVPKYFYMALLARTGNTYKALAFWTNHTNDAQSNTSISSCVITVDELERRTGIDFFCNLPDDIENAVESAVDTSFWNIGN
ncbi:MAG: DNA/RNA non-specific endonuclease [Muribaculaceae bacterium]|nr:DNA/RNA non-specific endonuclease [Muribaculaceae bacterium]